MPMSDYDIYETFRNNKSTLKECSKDNSDPNCIKFMTESQLEVINFDMVKTKYTNALKLSEECAASVDALLQADEASAFIEFKNGNLSGQAAKQNMKNKIRDSLLLFCGLTKQTIRDTRENLDFILVYNEEKNHSHNRPKKDEVSDSPSRIEIGSHFLCKGNEELIQFGLERYKHLYFREVHTYTKAEFDKYIEEKFAGGTVS